MCSLSGTVEKDVDLLSWVSEVERLGAGELLITSIDNDGTMEGYDEELLELVIKHVTIPVIVSGGAGSYEDFSKAANIGASAVAAASIYHFTEATPREAKLALQEDGFPVRL